jgi:hypothetical protein
MERIKESLCSGYKSAPAIVFICQFGGSDTFSRIKKILSTPNTIKARDFFLEQINKTKPENIEKPIVKVFHGSWVLKTPPSNIDFTNTLKLSDYVNTLGVICRQELKLDKLTPMPVRFRLGSLEYVNWLERKPNAITPK